MSWLDKLKDLIKVNFKISAPFIAINITKNNNLNFNNGYSYDKNKSILHLHIDKVLPEIKELLPDLTKEFIKEGNLLMEYKANDLLNKLYNYYKDNNDGAILAFFKPIIPSQDFEALESSLFIKNQFKSGNKVGYLKYHIRRRFGDRGNNIANLCTAGYFEEFLMPLYNSSIDNFKKIYEDIVSKSIVAVFVHKNMAVNDIPSEISKKIAISRKYGIRFIHIHGIGKENVITIKEHIEEKKELYDDIGFYDRKIFENEEKDIIIVELLFK